MLSDTLLRLQEQQVSAEDIEVVERTEKPGPEPVAETEEAAPSGNNARTPDQEKNEMLDFLRSL